MSHFSRADEPESDATLKQIACFEQFARGKPGQRSVAASGGTLLWPDAHNEWVRPGIILYGVSPLDNGSGAEHGLQPAMTLKSSLIAVREHKAGEAVGYGGTPGKPARYPAGRGGDGVRRRLPAQRADRYADSDQRPRSADRRPGVDGHDFGRSRAGRRR